MQKQMDYDQKRLMATRVIHHSKPCTGEPRTPTQSWSGLGFSNSMPENVIREKLAAEEASNKVRKKFKLNLFLVFRQSSKELSYKIHRYIYCI